MPKNQEDKWIEKFKKDISEDAESIIQKIYNQGKADALKEVGERVGYILNARLADFNVSRGEIKTLTDLKNYLEGKE